MKAFFWLILLISPSIFAQRIDETSYLFEIPDSSFIRISYDNDLFQAKDHYYTQGFTAVIMNPVLSKNPINHLLLKSRNTTTKNGIRLESIVYTPTDIVADSVLKNDRPFAAIISLGFLLQQRINKKLLLSSDFTLGIIGPAAWGNEIQTGIHRITKNSLPKGWKHQIKNDVVVNYSAQLEKILIQKRIVSISALAKSILGTYQTNVALGINAHLGWKQLTNSTETRRFNCFVYSQTFAKVVGYDASLQGGVFQRTSEHSFRYSEINPITLEQHLGFVLRVPHFYFGVNFGWITNEFKIGQQHSWGGLRIGFY